MLDAEDVEAVDELVAAWTQAVVAEDSFFAAEMKLKSLSKVKD